MDRRTGNTGQQQGASAEAEEGVHQRDTVPAPPPPEAIVAPPPEAIVAQASSDGTRLDETPLMVETHARDAYLHSLGKVVEQDPEPDVEQERPTARPAWDSEPTELFDATELASSERSITIPPPPALPSVEWEARNTPLVNPTVTREEALADHEVSDAERETAPGDLSAPIAASAQPDTDDREDDPTLPRTSLPELIPAEQRCPRSTTGGAMRADLAEKPAARATPSRRG